jgi:hypothetical protein
LTPIESTKLAAENATVEFVGEVVIAVARTLTGRALANT